MGMVFEISKISISYFKKVCDKWYFSVWRLEVELLGFELVFLIFFFEDDRDGWGYGWGFFLGCSV